MALPESPMIDWAERRWGDLGREGAVALSLVPIIHEEERARSPTGALVGRERFGFEFFMGGEFERIVPWIAEGVLRDFPAAARAWEERPCDEPCFRAAMESFTRAVDGPEETWPVDIVRFVAKLTSHLGRNDQWTPVFNAGAVREALDVARSPRGRAP